MIVECENCHKRYKIADEKIPSQGAKIKCPNCQSIIFVKKVPELVEKQNLKIEFQEELTKEARAPLKPETKCPKCGSINIRGDECLDCGIFISKYIKMRQQTMEKRQQETFYTSPESSSQTARPTPLLETKSYLGSGSEILQSRPAIITAALLLFITAIINLIGAEGDTQSISIIIVPSVIDIGIAFGLLMNAKTARDWALIRAVLGMIVWGGVALYHSDYTLFFAQIAVSASFIVLLTGLGSNIRIIAGIGIYAIAILVIAFIAPTEEMEMLKENTVPTTSSVIDSNQFPYSISMPSNNWQQLKKGTLNEESDIEIFKEKPEAYCLTIVEPAYGYSLQEFKSAIIQNMSSNISTLKVGGEKEIEIRGYKGVQMSHTAKIEGFDVKYYHTIVLSANYCFQIVCWSTTSQFSQNLKDFETIAYSLRIYD
jgi:predicted Zn finger-like uncharacterized protein